MTYSPNLWRVFLSYAQDCNAKVPSISLSVYPETAKTSEKVLFGIPAGAPNDPEHKVAENSVGLFMTEASCLKFCQDYGLMPHLVNRNDTKDIIFSLNREKTVLTRPKLKIQKPPTVFFQKTQASIIREQLGSNLKTRNFEKPMHFSAFESSRPIPKTKILPQRLTNPIYTLDETGGLGFSEFIELIAKIALDGMEAESYNVLFPTPFSKVLAILSVWGVADLKKLEEVRLINSIES
jgi:hypothetical protein